METANGTILMWESYTVLLKTNNKRTSSNAVSLCPFAIIFSWLSKNMFGSLRIYFWHHAKLYTIVCFVCFTALFKIYYILNTFTHFYEIYNLECWIVCGCVCSSIIHLKHVTLEIFVEHHISLRYWVDIGSIHRSASVTLEYGDGSRYTTDNRTMMNDIIKTESRT